MDLNTILIHLLLLNAVPSDILAAKKLEIFQNFLYIGDTVRKDHSHKKGKEEGLNK